MGEVGERGDIHLDHGIRARPVGGGEFPVVAMAGVVDEKRGPQARGIQLTGQSDARIGIREVAGEDVHLQRRPLCPERGGEGLHFTRAPRHQRDGRRLRCKLPRELRADAGRGSCDDGGAAGEGGPLPDIHRRDV